MITGTIIISMPYSNSTSSSIYSLSGADDAMMMHTWILTGDASPATGDASPVASETYAGATGRLKPWLG